MIGLEPFFTTEYIQFGFKVYLMFFKFILLTVTSTSEPTTTSGSLAISAPTPVREPTARIVYLSDLCAGDQSYVEEEGIIAEQVAQLLTVQYIIDQHNLANASSKVGKHSFSFLWAPFGNSGS